MNLELTKRDINLLKTLTTLLIAVVMGRYLIFPAIEKRQQLQFEIEEAELLQEEMQVAIEQIPLVKKSVEKLETGLTESAKPYYALKKEREIDELITGLAYKHSLFPSRLSIGSYKNEIPAPYLYSSLAEETKPEAVQNPNEEKKRYMQAVRVQITLGGDSSYVTAFMDDIEKNFPSIQISSFQVKKSSFMNEQLQIVEETSTDVGLIIYMHEEPEVIVQEALRAKEQSETAEEEEGDELENELANR